MKEVYKSTSYRGDNGPIVLLYDTWYIVACGVCDLRSGVALVL